MIVRLKATDYFDWHEMFQHTSEIRKQHGIVNESVYRGQLDGNEVVLVLEAESMTHAKAFAASPIRRAIHAKGLIVGTPIDCFHE
jgi:hypothetical protein